MEFGVNLDSSVTKDTKLKKGVWSVQDCKKYVEKNARLPSIQRGLPLHKLLKNSHFVVEEKKEVMIVLYDDYQPVSEEFENHMKRLRARQVQREYAEMVNDLTKRDTSLHINEVLDNPMDSVRNVVGMLMAAVTMGFAVYYLMKRSYPPAVAIPIGIVVFALMLVMEVVLMMARFYLSEHSDPLTKLKKEQMIHLLGQCFVCLLHIVCETRKQYYYCLYS